MSDAFLDALTQLMDEKVQLLDDISTNLGNAIDAQAVAGTLRTAAKKLHDFYQDTERPFERRYSSHLESPPEGAQRKIEERRTSINAFVSTLQKLKYGGTASADPEVASAIAEFELATCHIPSPN